MYQNIYNRENRINFQNMVNFEPFIGPFLGSFFEMMLNHDTFLGVDICLSLMSLEHFPAQWTQMTHFRRADDKKD